MTFKKLAVAAAMVAASAGANAAWDYGNAQDPFTAVGAEFIFVAWENGSSNEAFFQDLNLPVDTTDFLANPAQSFSVSVDAAYASFSSSDISWSVVGMISGQFSGSPFYPDSPAQTALITSNGDLSNANLPSMVNHATGGLAPAANGVANDWATDSAFFTTDPSKDAQGVGVYGTTFGASTGGADVTAALGESMSFYGVQEGNLIDFGGAWTFDGQTISYSAASAVPIPAAAWLFGSALLGLAGAARRRKA